jgi:elongation factor P
MKNAGRLTADQFIKKDNYSFKVIMTEAFSSAGHGQLMKVKVFNMDTGETINFNCPVDTEFAECNINHREMILKKRGTDRFLFVDENNLEELEIGSDMIGGSIQFLNDKAKVRISYYKELPVAVEMPDTAVLEVQDTEDIEKDLSNTSYVKDARLSNGRSVIVPAFIKTGDRVLIHVDTGEYIKRE